MNDRARLIEDQYGVDQLYLVSPSGKYFHLKVDDNGVLSLEAVDPLP